MTPDAPLRDLPLFPLGTVLFPQGLLSLKIFEARYLDLISRCLRERAPFGVVTLVQGGEVRVAGEAVRFEPVGCLAEVRHCDSDQPGILQVRCAGTYRFSLEAPRQRDDGLWLAGSATPMPDDIAQPPRPERDAAVAALRRAVAALDERGQHPILPPHRYDDAGWVANRWCELVPLPLGTRHRLMALGDPHARLELIDGFLRRHGIVSG